MAFWDKEHSIGVQTCRRVVDDLPLSFVHYKITIWQHSLGADHCLGIIPIWQHSTVHFYWHVVNILPAVLQILESALDLLLEASHLIVEETIISVLPPVGGITLTVDEILTNCWRVILAGCATPRRTAMTV